MHSRPDNGHVRETETETDSETEAEAESDAETETEADPVSACTTEGPWERTP